MIGKTLDYCRITDQPFIWRQRSIATQAAEQKSNRPGVTRSLKIGAGESDETLNGGQP